MSKQFEEIIKAGGAGYLCLFRATEDGSYNVRCGAFPGLITDGDTLEEVQVNAREALELCIDVFVEKGWPLPPSDGASSVMQQKFPVKLARA